MFNLQLFTLAATCVIVNAGYHHGGYKGEQEVLTDFGGHGIGSPGYGGHGVPVSVITTHGNELSGNTHGDFSDLTGGGHGHFVGQIAYPGLVKGTGNYIPASYDKGHGYYSYPKYQFNYAVADPYTGDHKSHWESRDGDVVRGSYSLLEPDGTTRIVEYTADKFGFHPIVKRIGVAKHPQPHFNPHGHHGQNIHY